MVRKSHWKEAEVLTNYSLFILGVQILQKLKLSLDYLYENPRWYQRIPADAAREQPAPSSDTQQLNEPPWMLTTDIHKDLEMVSAHKDKIFTQNG